MTDVKSEEEVGAKTGKGGMGGGGVVERERGGWGGEKKNGGGNRCSPCDLYNSQLSFCSLTTAALEEMKRRGRGSAGNVRQKGNGGVGG